ncbi:DUF5908 family protein, partial [Serratia ureilytica]|uniref:DUF5908 family protein n=2 Tax=Serratia ureilytica TaxID=300181 RepID=UPI0021D50C16
GGEGGVMLEIRELVIEARVTDDTPRQPAATWGGGTEAERTALIEQVVRQVLAALDEQRERL